MNTDLIDALVKKLKGELVQTHASWVILTKDFAYKIKKPVNFGFLDYSTLEKRRENCLREVELNRRLCPWVYVGVLAVVKVGSEYFLEGEGEVVECYLAGGYGGACKKVQGMIKCFYLVLTQGVRT